MITQASRLELHDQTTLHRKCGSGALWHCRETFFLIPSHNNKVDPIATYFNTVFPSTPCFPFGFPTKILHTFLFTSLFLNCFTHVTLFHLITLELHEDNKPWRPSIYRVIQMIVGVLTTCHTQYTYDSSIRIFLFNRTTLQVFVTYLTGAIYVHPLWFYKHQHDNRVRSACQRWRFQWRFWFVPSVPGYTRTLSLETVHTTFEWNCQMVVVSRIWCGIAAGQLYPDNNFE